MTSNLNNNKNFEEYPFCDPKFKNEYENGGFTKEIKNKIDNNELSLFTIINAIERSKNEGTTINESLEEFCSYDKFKVKYYYSA
jgi:hypothetical protein